MGKDKLEEKLYLVTYSLGLATNAVVQLATSNEDAEKRFLYSRNCVIRDDFIIHSARELTIPGYKITLEKIAEESDSQVE